MAEFTSFSKLKSFVIFFFFFAECYSPVSNYIVSSKVYERVLACRLQAQRALVGSFYSASVSNVI